MAARKGKAGGLDDVVGPWRPTLKTSGRVSGAGLLVPVEVPRRALLEPQALVLGRLLQEVGRLLEDVLGLGLVGRLRVLERVAGRDLVRLAVGPGSWPADRAQRLGRDRGGLRLRGRGGALGARIPAAEATGLALGLLARAPTPRAMTSTRRVGTGPLESDASDGVSQASMPLPEGYSPEATAGRPAAGVARTVGLRPACLVERVVGGRTARPCPSRAGVHASEAAGGGDPQRAAAGQRKLERIVRRGRARRSDTRPRGRLGERDRHLIPAVAGPDRRSRARSARTRATRAARVARMCPEVSLTA